MALLYGKRARAYVLRTIVYNYAAGSVDEAARYAMSRLVRQPDGRPIPIDCDADDFAPFGGEVHAYVSFVQRACVVFLLCFLLSLAQLLNNLKGGDMGGDLNPLSALSLGNLRRLQISNAISELVISGVLVHFLFAARRAEILGSIEARAAEVTPADFSVLIRGLSPDTRDAARVAELLGSLGVRRHEIVALTLSADLRGLILLTRQREAVKREENTLLARCFLLRRELRAIRAWRLRELIDLRDLREPTPPQSSGAASGQTGASTTRAADEVESELRAIRRRLSEVSAAVLDLAHQKRCLLAAGHRCTGHAYVTFNTESAAEQCIAAVNRRRTDETTKQPPGGRAGVASLTPEDVLWHDLSAERPPEPEEVYWDELQFGRSHFIRGHLQAGAMILAVALLGTAVITVANYGMGPVMRAAEGPWLKVASMQVGFTVMIILGNIFIFLLTPILADKLEHHHTFGSKQLSCFLKMYIFQVFNTVVASTVFYFWAQPARHSWYAYGSSMVFNVLLGDTFVISILLDALQPAVLVARHLKAPRASCQREMNELYACQANALRSILPAHHSGLSLLSSLPSHFPWPSACMAGRHLCGLPAAARRQVYHHHANLLCRSAAGLWPRSLLPLARAVDRPRQPAPQARAAATLSRQADQRRAAMRVACRHRCAPGHLPHVLSQRAQTRRERPAVRRARCRRDRRLPLHSPRRQRFSGRRVRAISRAHEHARAAAALPDCGDAARGAHLRGDRGLLGGAVGLFLAAVRLPRVRTPY